MNSFSNTNRKIVIAIDGFSSCGKSTFARMLAAKLGYIFIDTGAMYRALTLSAIRHDAVKNGFPDTEMLPEILNNTNISFRFDPDRQSSDIYVNGECVEDKIRSIEVSTVVSRISCIPAVREKLVGMQQEMGRNKGVVMDGRDIGTVVFPDAELKIFMVADPAIRAERRYAELRAKGEEVSLEEIEKNIRERDLADQNRSVSPLRQAEDAIVLDNSRMSIEEQMKWIEPIVNERLQQAANK